MTCPFLNLTLRNSNKFCGNRFAITSQGVGVALQKSASALAYANNTIDESIGLIVAANATVQDPEIVGTAIKTLSMRLRASKASMEEAGLETEGMAETTASLRKELMAISGVDIMLDENTLKSTYQIMVELANVWEEMTDVESAAVLELIAGKRMANTAASIIQNIKDAESAYNVSRYESDNSAIAENEKYLESIQGRLDKLSATYESLSQNLIDSDTIKIAVDTLTTLLDIFDRGVETLGEWPVIITTITSAFAIFSKQGSKALDFLNVTRDAQTGSTKIGLGSAFSLDFSGSKLNEELFAGITSEFNYLNDLIAGGLELDDIKAAAQSLYDENMINAEALDFVNQELDQYSDNIGQAKIDAGKFAEQQGAVTAKTAAATTATKVFNAVLNQAIIFLAVAALQALAKAIDDYIHRVDIAKQEAQDFFNEFESGKNELDKINSRLEEIKQRVDEINRMPKISLAEKSELDNLREESAELEHQRMIQEHLNKNNERLAKERATWAYENDRVVTGISATITEPTQAGQVGSNIGNSNMRYGIGFGDVSSAKKAYSVQSVSKADYLVTLANKEVEINNKIAEAEEKFAQIENPTAEDMSARNEELTKLNDELESNSELVNKTLDDLRSTLEIVGADSDIGKEIIAGMGKYFKTVDPTYIIDTFIDKASQSDDRKKIEAFMLRLKNGEITERGAAASLGRVAPKLVAELESVGVSAEDVIDILNNIDYYKLTSAMNDAAIEAQIYSNQELAETFSNVSSKVDELGKAYWEQAQNGSISLTTLQSLMANHENWMDMITVENGLIKLNGEVATMTAREYIQAEINKLKASLSTLEAIKASTDSLREQAAVLGSMSASAILAQESLGDDEYRRTEAAISALEALLDSTANGFTHLAEATSAAADAQEKYNQALKLEGEMAIKAIDKKIDAKRKALEQLEEEYEAEDKLFELQKARDRYEAAKNNLNTRLYTEDRGWIWVADPKELQDSREALDELEKKNARDEAKKAIEDEIDALEDLKNKYQDAMDQIGMDLEEHADMLEWLAKFEEMTYDELAAYVEEYADKVVAEYERIAAAKREAANAGGGGGTSSGNSTGTTTKTYTPNKTATTETFGPLLTKEKTTTVYVHGSAVSSTELNKIKNKVSQFASGTRNSPTSGPAIVDEKGPELIAKHNATGRLTHLELGDTVYPADMTQRLWDLAVAGAFAMTAAKQMPIRTNLHEEAFMAKQAISNSNDIVLTGCSFQLNNVTDVDSFFGELNRIANRHRRK